MALNLQDELTRLYGASRQQEESLADRLGKLDEYAAQVNPLVRGQLLDFSNRPAGYNPLTDVKSAIEFSETARGQRAAAATDASNAQKNSLDILGTLQGMAEKQQAQQDDLVKEAIKAGQAYLKVNPETGKLEISYDVENAPQDKAVKAYADRIQSGDMKFTEVPSEKRDQVVLELADRPLSSEEKLTYQGIKQEIEKMRSMINPGKFWGIIPMTPKKAEIQTTRKLLAMEIARLYEKGRLSDKDREFYLSLLPDQTTPIPTAITALDTIQSMIDARFSKYSGESGESSESVLDTEDEALIEKYRPK